MSETLMRQVVGAALLDKNIALELEKLLPLTGLDGYRVIVQALSDIAKEGFSWDNGAHIEELAKRTKLSGLWLAGFCEDAPADPGMASFLIRQFRQLSYRSSIRELAACITELPESEIDTFVDNMEALIGSFRRIQTDTTTSPRELKEAVIEALEIGDEGVGPKHWCGLHQLEQITGRLHPGLSIIGARTGLGKSTFLLQAGLKWAKESGPVVYANAEMSERELGRRAATHLGIGGSQKADLVPDGFRIIPPERCDLSYILQFARSTRGIGLLEIDYIQLIRTDKQETREREVATISRALHALGLELGIPVLAAAQLRRLNHGPATLESLRESGSIEQDAGLVMLLCEEQGTKFIDVAKNRYGASSKVQVKLVPRLMRIEEIYEA